MSRTDRFVDPTETTRIAISDGDAIVIKQRLSKGEQLAIENANLRTLYGTRTAAGLPRVEVDLEGYKIVRLFTWLVEWSLIDKTGKSVALTPAACANLDPDTFDEMETAITAHITARAAEKKTAALLKTTATAPSGSAPSA
jgi:hypothetical protein